MVNFKKIKKVTMVSAMAALMAGTSSIFPGVAQGSEEVSGSISPDSYSANINEDETVTLERTIQVNVGDTVATEVITKPGKLDVLFLADNTGSMGSAIENVQEQASELLNSLDNTYGDVEIGVARYFGNPDEYSTSQTHRYVLAGTKSNYERVATYANRTTVFGTRYGPRTYYLYNYQLKKNGKVSSTYHRWQSSSFHDRYRSSGYRYSWTTDDYKSVPVSSRGEIAYELQEKVNGGSRDKALEAIDSWFASGGGDHPEGNFFALHQAATSGDSIGGHSTDYETKWRPDAKRLIVWFGDARSHTSVASQADAIAALKDNDISVIAINAYTNSSSIAYGIDYQSQASTVASETGGLFSGSSTSSVAETIGNLIEEVATEVTTVTAGTVNLNFESQGDTSGLDIVYTCTDDRGCDGVTDGESRTFEMDVTGNASGTYSFNTIATGVDGAIASNKIIVGNPPNIADDKAYSYFRAAVNVPVLDNDYDPDGDELSIDRFTQGAHGTVIINSDGNLIYTPNANAPVGTDTFTYTASDEDGIEGTATVTIEYVDQVPD